MKSNFESKMKIEPKTLQIHTILQRHCIYSLLPVKITKRHIRSRNYVPQEVHGELLESA